MPIVAIALVLGLFLLASKKRDTTPKQLAPWDPEFWQNPGVVPKSGTSKITSTSVPLSGPNLNQLDPSNWQPIRATNTTSSSLIGGGSAIKPLTVNWCPGTPVYLSKLQEFAAMANQTGGSYGPKMFFALVPGTIPPPTGLPTLVVVTADGKFWDYRLNVTNPGHNTLLEQQFCQYVNNTGPTAQASGE